MILSKYDSDTDVYQHYHFTDDTVTYVKRYLHSQSTKTVRKWTHTIQELGWTSKERYMNHLKTMGYREVKSYERMATPETAAV